MKFKGEEALVTAGNFARGFAFIVNFSGSPNCLFMQSTRNCRGALTTNFSDTLKPCGVNSVGNKLLWIHIPIKYFLLSRVIISTYIHQWLLCHWNIHKITTVVLPHQSHKHRGKRKWRHWKGRSAVHDIPIGCQLWYCVYFSQIFTVGLFSTRSSLPLDPYSFHLLYQLVISDLEKKR